MDAPERAKQIAHLLQNVLQPEAAPVLSGADHPGQVTAGDQPERNFTLTRQEGCLSCNPGCCPECGYLFTGEAVVINHKLRGKLILSDRAIHYLSHGLTRYQTGYVVRGEPVVVSFDLEELAGYLDLSF